MDELNRPGVLWTCVFKSRLLNIFAIIVYSFTNIVTAFVLTLFVFVIFSQHLISELQRVGICLPALTICGYCRSWRKFHGTTFRRREVRRKQTLRPKMLHFVLRLRQVLTSLREHPVKDPLLQQVVSSLFIRNTRRICFHALTLRLFVRSSSAIAPVVVRVCSGFARSRGRSVSPSILPGSAS